MYNSTVYRQEKYLIRYVEWSYHEPEERQYNFEGDRDLVRFVQTAAEVGLHVLLRVGPYICAERDLVSSLFLYALC